VTSGPITIGSLRSRAVLDQALAASNAAAARAGVDVVELNDVTRVRSASELFDAVWSTSGEDQLMPATTLRALSHAGSYAFGAVSSGRMVGAIVGFLGRLDGQLQLHSHILGVDPASQGRNVGFALKQHQRAWALDQGIDVVTWTFDPLVRRNAYFNMAKLGASVRAYHRDFYGSMSDGINSGDDSDRVLVEWSLGDEAVVAASEGRPLDLDLRTLEAQGAATLLREDVEGAPLAGAGAGRVLLAAVPEDIVALRARHPGMAGRWRLALRDVFTRALEDGYLTVGMTRSGSYVFRRPDR
jgi:predicted GNAT superfamily acetyltransferase